MVFPQLLVNGIVASSIIALAGVSWWIIYNTTKVFHFAHMLVFAVGGYAAALLTTHLNLHFAYGFCASILFSVLLGCSIEKFLYQYLRKKNAPPSVIFLASLGFATAGVALILLILSSNPRTIADFPNVVISFKGISTTSTDIITILVGCISILAVIIFLKKSSYGKAIRAVASNKEMAANLGIDINKIYLIAFGIGSGLFGIASFLFTAKNVAYPTMGTYPFFMAFTAVFLGGVNSIIGCVLAGIVLGMAENLGMIILPGEYKVMIAYGILFFVILIKPEGLITSK